MVSALFKYMQSFFELGLSSGLWKVWSPNLYMQNQKDDTI